MKWFIRGLFILILTFFSYGFYVRYFEEVLKGDRIIGLSVLTTVFVLMPAFLVYSWKGKKLNDYMLTKENLDKMNNKK